MFYISYDFFIRESNYFESLLLKPIRPFCITHLLVWQLMVATIQFND